jgi:cytochrome c-type biogenesis protein CcmH/NrfF
MLLVAWLLAAPAAVATPETDPEHAPPAASDSAELTAFVPGASRLEGRIRAPCCWNTTGQTLDIHGSPSALALRREIRQRLRAGESPETIEASIVDRYGEHILAVPNQSPLKKFAVGLSVVVGAAGVGAIVMLGRWRRRTQQSKRTKKRGSESAGRDELDDRVDEELERLDE